MTQTPVDRIMPCSSSRLTCCRTPQNKPRHISLIYFLNLINHLNMCIWLPSFHWPKKERERRGGRGDLIVDIWFSFSFSLRSSMVALGHWSCTLPPKAAFTHPPSIHAATSWVFLPELSEARVTRWRGITSCPQLPHQPLHPWATYCREKSFKCGS